MAAIAQIPFGILRFRSCICVIQYQRIEYQFATYLGVRVVRCTGEEIVLRQGRYRLRIRVYPQNSHSLSAPRNGKMSRSIREAASCPASYTLYQGKERIFHLKSRHTCFESE